MCEASILVCALVWQLLHLVERWVVVVVVVVVVAVVTTLWNHGCKQKVVESSSGNDLQTRKIEIVNAQLDHDQTYLVCRLECYFSKFVQTTFPQGYCSKLKTMLRISIPLH